MSAKTVSPVAATTVRSNQIGWIALTLTPGLGPTRSRKLIEFFGGIEGVLNASLTSLEAAGLPVAAAQSLGTGKSLELAQDEIAKADAAGVQLLPMDDPLYPPRLRQIYDPPLVLYVRGNVGALPARRRCRRHTPSHALRHWHGRAPSMRSGNARPRHLQRPRARR